MPETVVHQSQKVTVRSCPSSDREPLIAKAHDRIELVETWGGWFERKFKCGHKAKKKYRIDVYGSTLTNANRDFCPDCAIKDLKEHVIRCCLCGLPIMEHDPVVIYGSGTPGIQEDIATQVGDGYMGCMRWACEIGAGMFFSGHWTSEGFVSCWDKSEEESDNG